MIGVPLPQCPGGTDKHPDTQLSGCLSRIRHPTGRQYCCFVGQAEGASSPDPTLPTMG